jgi:predicted protein tyrosine phosphatase
MDASSSAISELRDTQPTSRARCSGSAATEVSSSPVAAELAAFVDGWEKVLDHCVHCAEVLKRIKNFAGATHTLYPHQSDELRVVRRVRKCSRELEGKSRMLRQAYVLIC